MDRRQFEDIAQRSARVARFTYYFGAFTVAVALPLLAWIYDAETVGILQTLRNPDAHYLHWNYHARMIAALFAILAIAPAIAPIPLAVLVHRRLGMKCPACGIMLTFFNRPFNVLKFGICPRCSAKICPPEVDGVEEAAACDTSVLEKQRELEETNMPSAVRARTSLEFFRAFWLSQSAESVLCVGSLGVVIMGAAAVCQPTEVALRAVAEWWRAMPKAISLKPGDDPIHVASFIIGIVVMILATIPLFLMLDHRLALRCWRCATRLDDWQKFPAAMKKGVCHKCQAPLFGSDGGLTNLGPRND